MENVARLRLNHWLLPLMAFLAALALSSIPGSTIGAPRIPNLDKMVHCVEYACIGFVVARSAVAAYSRTPMALVVAVVLVAGFGALDELYQMLIPGRTSDRYDLLADVVGGILGATAFLVLSRRKNEHG